MSTDSPAGEAVPAPEEEATAASAPPPSDAPAGQRQDPPEPTTADGSAADTAGPEEPTNPGEPTGSGAPAGPGEREGSEEGGGDGEGGADARSAPAGGAKRSAAAEALAAAVRAVETGERSAASFFNEPTRPPAQRTAGQDKAAAGAPAGRGPRPGAEAAGGPGTGPGPLAPRPAPRAETAGDGSGALDPARAGHGAADPEAVGDVRQVLAAGGAPEQLADQVTAVLGERAAEALREDPWQLLTVPGVRHDQADGFARALLGPACGPGDERRSQALTGWLLERAALEGHTAMESDALRAALGKLSVPDPDEALRAVVADGGVLVFQDALDALPGPRAAAADSEEDAEQPVRVLLGLDRYALAEESLADGLSRLASTLTAPDTSDGAPDDAATGPAPDWEAAAATAPSPSAAELIRAAADSGLVAHSGGEAARAEPAALIAVARAMGLRAFGATHGEDGRRRLAAAIAAQDTPAGNDTPGAADAAADGDAAVTLAGLLSGGEGPGRDADGALALDLVAVLDAPQLDVETAAMLVESLPDGARLVLSGDPGVLGSAGPGQVFADVLTARCCPQVVSRTPDPGPIGELVSGIGIGELNQVEAPGKEVVIVPVREAAEAVHRTVQLVADSIPRAIGVPPEGTQVITPGHGGAAGTRVLNTALKERLNPGPGRFGGFDPGDRVAYVPAPGRTLPGTVVSADADGLRLDCAGAPLVVPRERVQETVRHGWALTAHQAAGLRWPAVVVVLPGDATAVLTRSWVYTAFGRGERHLSVVHGVDSALPRAVAEIPFTERTTRLRSLLRPRSAHTG